MNAFLNSKPFFVAYGGIILSFAAVYAILFGVSSGFAAEYIAADAAVYWLLFGGTGLSVWNIVNYAIPPRGGAFLKGFMVSMVVIIAVIFSVGLETLAMSVYPGGVLFAAFVSTLPPRILVTALAFVIVILYHRLHADTPGEQADITEPAGRRGGEILERITIKNGKKIKVIRVGEIEYLQAAGDYVAIVTDEGRWLKEQTMKHFEEYLPAEEFARIHRSYIVNIARIVRLERYGNQYQVTLSSGENIKVSAAGYKTLKERLSL